VNEHAPLSYGQLSVWRDVRDLRRDRWHEANTRVVWRLPDGDGHSASEVEDAVLALARRHESLRTVYDLADTFAPSQRVLPRLLGADSGAVECRPADLDALLTELTAEPFDLREAPSWRSRVVTRGGRPRAVVLVQHHIGADGWSSGLLEAEFRDTLGSSGSAARSPAPTPRELAVWQRSAGRRARRAALTAYWERIYRLTPAALGPAPAAGTARDAAYQYSARSRQAYAAARRQADRLRVPVSSVVLAAFAWSATRAAGHGTPVAQLMSSNRFFPSWNSVVSSMNQWTAAELGPPGDDFGAYAGQVHTRSLPAYRHGMYDVDEMDALRGEVRAAGAPYQATFAFNFLTDGPAPPGGADGPEAVQETPFSRIGHPCYLRATDEGGESLHLRLRTLGLHDTFTRDLLTSTVARLTDAAV
jgi:hypothetical protein